MKAFNVIGENALIGVVEPKTDAITVIVHAKDIVVERRILISCKTGNPVAIVKCPNKRPSSTLPVTRFQALPGTNVEYLAD